MLNHTLSPIRTTPENTLLTVSAPIGALESSVLTEPLNTITDNFTRFAGGDDIHFNAYFAVIEKKMGAFSKFDMAALIETNALSFIVKRFVEVVSYLFGCDQVLIIKHLGYYLQPEQEVAHQYDELFRNQVYAIAISVNGRCGFLNQADALLREQF